MRFRKCIYLAIGAAMMMLSGMSYAVTDAFAVDGVLANAPAFEQVATTTPNPAMPTSLATSQAQTVFVACSSKLHINLETTKPSPYWSVVALPTAIASYTHSEYG